jgi:hypothetical protein
MFAVDYTTALHAALLDTMTAMRNDVAHNEAHRSHDEAARCTHCGYRQACDERLA